MRGGYPPLKQVYRAKDVTILFSRLFNKTEEKIKPTAKLFLNGRHKSLYLKIKMNAKNKEKKQYHLGVGQNKFPTIPSNRLLPAFNFGISHYLGVNF